MGHKVLNKNRSVFMISDRLDHFLFNDNSKEQIRQIVDNIKVSDESGDPILLYGSSAIMCELYLFLEEELEGHIKICNAESFGRPGDLAGMLTCLESNDVLLIKDIDLLDEYVEEYLLGAVVDGNIDIAIGNNARTINIELNQFNLIATTTDPELLSDNLTKIIKTSLCVDYSTDDKDTLSNAMEYATKNVYETSFQNLYSEIRVPIGLCKSNILEFTFDAVSHSHAFILGQSGSGKSVLLHSIITSMILRYAPEYLQLYLLDFKMGGVEFNRYKSVKHLKALLVDNSDIHITLEILRDIDSQMKERGKMLRNAGVANIRDYNEKNKDARMPTIVLVADECHIMFSTQDSKSRRIQSEISNIITKIAKEGRSQGVHLLLATQTLAGTEIANEIMNNITDHYLLKCAVSDSEKMASDSSKITSQLSTGQVYYHHTDEQVQFKAFYSTNEELAERITNALNKSADCQSNGQFYFNGSQVFTVDKDVIKYVGKKGRRNPTVALGRGISLEEKPISIILKEDYSENILLFGINNDEQVTRVTMNILMTMASSVKQKDMDMDIYVFDCLNNEDGIYAEVLDEMEDMGLCNIVSGRKRGVLLKKLADEIANGKVNPSTLFILGQEKFRELRMNMEIEDKQNNDGGLFAGLDFSNSNDGKILVKTYQEALRYILECGPEVGVHTVLQIDKPDKLLFSDYSVSAKEVFRMFKHLVMLHSDENAASRLIDNEIKLESLSGDNERLRAYYYSDDDDKYTLFTPYDMPTIENLTELLS